MKWLAEKLVVLGGWTIEGAGPTIDKAVLVGAPHTSNWDFIVFLAVVHRFGLAVRFLVKDGLMVWPLSWLMKRWGAIPVERSSHHHLIEAAVRSFDEHDEMLLVIAPEGTRARADRWKSGFWRIADAADVPVVMAFIDGETKRTGFGPAFKIDGDPEAWMTHAETFYADKHGLKPQNVGPVRL